jgi:hypothetical protein
VRIVAFQKDSDSKKNSTRQATKSTFHFYSARENHESQIPFPTHSIASLNMFFYLLAEPNTIKQFAVFHFYIFLVLARLHVEIFHCQWLLRK